MSRLPVAPSLPALSAALFVGLSACGSQAEPTPVEATPVAAADPGSAAGPAAQAAGPGGRGPATLTAMQARADENFDRLDADHDGVVMAAELAAAEAAGGRGGRRLARADADGDGRVTREEARAASAAMFARLDADGDGTISAAERPQRGGRGGDRPD